MTTDASGIAELTDDYTGRWAVQTEASTHIVDLDARTVTRLDGAGGGPLPIPGEVIVAALLRDRDPVSLIRLERCRVGEMAVFLLQVRTDDIVTLRRTSFVRSINQLSGNGAQ